MKISSYFVENEFQRIHYNIAKRQLVFGRIRIFLLCPFLVVSILFEGACGHCWRKGSFSRGLGRGQNFLQQGGSGARRKQVAVRKKIGGVKTRGMLKK